MKLTTATIPPYLKIGFFGNTGTGKSYTASKVMAQFVKEYALDKQIVMFDTEASAGFTAPLIKEITGKELLTASSRSFADLMDVTDQCIKAGHVLIVDSVTHPWRTLCTDYLEAKKSRVKASGGREETVRLSVKDWHPLKEIWAKFSELFLYSPIHACIIGREGDVWETVKTEYGDEEMQKTGERMKTESEFGYEPYLLVQMKLNNLRHQAFIVKDKRSILTGKLSEDAPDIEFFRPHIACLNIGGKPIEKSEGKKIFNEGTGPNWETLQAQRAGLLENIKDDLLLAYPGRSTEENKAKIEALRASFNTSSWTELESDILRYSIEKLIEGRSNLAILLNKK